MINEQQHSERVGYKERMHADEFFVSAFRQDTSYVYNAYDCIFLSWLC